MRKKLDEAVILWVNVAENNHIPITWLMIHQKATDYAERLGIEGFKGSNGWMHRFAMRNSLKMHRIHGEAGSADTTAVDIDKEKIRDIMAKYERQDIYNFDETALFYTAAPRTTIAHGSFSGIKENKKRLTVGLICNADGTDKWLEPLLIGHAKKPDCFKNSIGKRLSAADHGFSLYFNNQNAWMTKVIFQYFLRRFDRSMVAKKRKVLLLLDNFAGHMVEYKPVNVELLFLPPNTTSRLQPLDGGIIRAFKAHFKRRQFQKAYRHIGMTQIGRQDLVGPAENIFDVDQLQAMK